MIVGQSEVKIQSSRPTKFFFSAKSESEIRKTTHAAQCRLAD